MNIKTIPLTRDKLAIVDAADYAWLSQWKWQAFKNRHTWYVSRKERLADGKRYNIYMHREILGLKYGDALACDHVNLNGLDNRRVNLRLATHAENLRNRSKQFNNTSGYKGVSWHKRAKCWVARIGIDGKKHHLGCFDDVVEAARAYDEAVIKYHGEFATGNKAKPGGEEA